ncbi:MAG: O-antigen ligase family protein [Dehalococcoidia bacterium]
MSEQAQQASTPAPLRFLALLAAASWLGYLICSGVPQMELQVFRATVSFQATALVPAMLYAAYLLFKRRLPGGSRLDWPLLLLLAAYGVATVASIAWRVSLESTLIFLLAVLVFYALNDLEWLDAHGLQAAFLLAASAAAVWALWIVWGDYRDWLNLARETSGGFHLSNLIPPTVPKVHDVSDHPNILGMILVLAMPFYILSVYRTRAAWLRIFWGVMLFAALWAIFLTLARGAWAGAAVAVAVTVVGIAAVRGDWTVETARRSFGRLRARPSLAVVAGVLALLVVALAIAVLAVRWNVRPQWLFRQSISPREDVFNAGVSILRDHPLFGGGPGTFAQLYPQYSGEFPIHAVHAHNGFLQLADDTGIVGLAALAALLATLGWMLWQSYRRGSVEQRLLAVTCAAALTGFAVHNLVDAANMWKAALAAIAAVTAIIVKNYGSLARTEAMERRLPPWVGRLRSLLPRGLLAVAFIALPLVWLRIDVAHRHYSHSLSQLAMGRDAQAISEGQQAVDLDPDFAIYQLQLGVAEGTAVMRREMSSPDAAIASLKRGLELEPRSAIGYANLARMLVVAGQKDEARQAALEARRYAGADSTVLLAAAGVLEDVGAPEAIPTYGMALSRMPSLADSSFWQGSEFRRTHYAEIIGNSLISLSPCATGTLMAEMGDTAPKTTTKSLAQLRDDCQGIVSADPAGLDARIDLAEISMALKDYQTAYDLLTYVTSRQPDQARARTVMGEWYAAQGDVTRARAEWTTGGQLGEVESLLLLDESYPPGQVPPEVAKRLMELAPAVGGGSRDYLIGILYYRMHFSRESSPIILLPGEWENAIPGLYDRIQQALQR